MRFSHLFLPTRLHAPGVLLSVLLVMSVPALGQKPSGNLREARKSVVFIRRMAPGQPPAVGTGFLVSKDGLIYTNRHVVAPEEDETKGAVIVVGVPSEKDPDVLEFYKAEIAALPAAGEDLDFAAIKIAHKTPGYAFKTLPLSYEKLELGDPVTVLGYPRVTETESHLSLNKGSISATRVRLEGKQYYQTDAAVNPGNSGGPLLNAKGEAVGIITFKQQGADNIGFALILNEIKTLAGTAVAKAAKLKPEPGPVKITNLPRPAGIAPKLANWEVTRGEAKEMMGRLRIDNNGGTYWLTSKEPLPDDFQLVIRCFVEFLEGGQFIQPSQESILRMLCVRFATDDTKTDIMERKGNLIQFSHELLILWKEGQDLKVEHKGNPDEPFTLTITKKGGDYTVTMDQEILLKYHDDKPLKGGQKFCIGGYLSRLHLAEVSIIKL